MSAVPALSALEELAERHSDTLRIAANRARRLPLLLCGLFVYLVASWWFFSIGSILAAANWPIAGTYLASWVSYEIRPEFRIAPDGAMTLNYGRGPLGKDPKPDWVRLETAVRSPEKPAAAAAARTTAPAATPAKTSSFNFMSPDAAPMAGDAAPAAPQEKVETVITRAAVMLSGAASLAITPSQVDVKNGDEVVSIRLADGRAEPIGSLPGWAEQKRAGEKIVLSFGLAGWAEVSGDRINVRNRFFGWANFLFDTQSPFFGKPYSEVWRLVLSGDRIDPSRSNLALAWNNICYNAEWQHLDVWTKLLQTIVMAFAGTLFAALLAFPLAFLAARTITASRVLNQGTKRLFDFLRSVDMFIWALFFTRAFGPGPLAGMAAIFFTDTGTLGKLFSEALENIDDRQREGVRSLGASPLSVQRYGILPQVLPVFASQTLYFWESNTRSATIIGAVGAGGIGLKLWEAIRTNSNWANVAYMVLLLLLVVFIFDSLSNALRSRLIGRVNA